MGEKIELENPTPKEKAIELIDKYKPLCGGYWGGKINKEFAKQSAIIAVNEIILSIKNLNEIDETLFWLDVKQEIEKL